MANTKVTTWHVFHLLIASAYTTICPQIVLIWFPEIVASVSERATLPRRIGFATSFSHPSYEISLVWQGSYWLVSCTILQGSKNPSPSCKGSTNDHMPLSYQNLMPLFRHTSQMVKLNAISVQLNHFRSDNVFLAFLKPRRQNSRDHYDGRILWFQNIPSILFTRSIDPVKDPLLSSDPLC
jgi:hypothetical protein